MPSTHRASMKAKEAERKARVRYGDSLTYEQAIATVEALRHEPHAPAPYNYQAAARAIAGVRGVPWHHILGTGRAKQTVECRAEIVWYLRGLGLSFPEAARVLGRRNHSSAFSQNRRWKAKQEKAK